MKKTLSYVLHYLPLPFIISIIVSLFLCWRIQPPSKRTIFNFFTLFKSWNSFLQGNYCIIIQTRSIEFYLVRKTHWSTLKCKINYLKSSYSVSTLVSCILWELLIKLRKVFQDLFNNPYSILLALFFVD